MEILIPGLLLIAAAGGAAYYFLVYKKAAKPPVVSVPKPRDISQAVKHAKDKIDHASDHKDGSSA